MMVEPLKIIMADLPGTRISIYFLGNPFTK